MPEKIKIMFNEEPNHHTGKFTEVYAYRDPNFKITEQTEQKFVYQY